MSSNVSISIRHSRSILASSRLSSSAPRSILLSLLLLLLLKFKYTLGFLLAISATSQVGKIFRMDNNRDETRSRPTRKSKSSTSRSLLFAFVVVRSDGRSISKRSFIFEYSPSSSDSISRSRLSLKNSLCNCSSVTKTDVSRSRCTS